jgi:hypothetical protein
MTFPRLPRLVCALLVIGALVPSSTSALTLGDLPSTDPGSCGISSSLWLMQVASTTATYVVPAGGGIITGWSTSFGPAGAPVELVVSSPFATSAPFTAVVRGVDYETLPNPLPASNVDTFTLARPIAVRAGDLIGLNVFGGSGTSCTFSGASGDQVYAGGGEPVVPGGTIAPAIGGPSLLVNLSANLVQSADLAITAAATPRAISRGDVGELSFHIAGGPIATATFTDAVPAGLVPVSADTAGGSCTISGQSVSCTLTSSPSTVDVVVRGASAGVYTDSAHIASPLSDPGPANNSASAMLVVGTATANCMVPDLRGLTLRRAKALLPLVDCSVGKVRKTASSHVPKGDVISTSPHAGTTSDPGTKVAITVSSGKHRKRHR